MDRDRDGLRSGAFSTEEATNRFNRAVGIESLPGWIKPMTMTDRLRLEEAHSQYRNIVQSLFEEDKLPARAVALLQQQRRILFEVQNNA